MRTRKRDSYRGQRGTEERAHQDGRHLVWVVLDDTEGDAKQAFQHMDAAKSEAFLRRLMEVDTADVKDGQSQPSNPIPV